MAEGVLPPNPTCTPSRLQALADKQANHAHRPSSMPAHLSIMSVLALFASLPTPSLCMPPAAAPNRWHHVLAGPFERLANTQLWDDRRRPSEGTIDY